LADANNHLSQRSKKSLARLATVLTAFIVTRNRWRDEMIQRGVARYNWQTGKWEWGEPPKEPTTWAARAAE
jgi:hypothetical protein